MIAQISQISSLFDYVMTFWWSDSLLKQSELLQRESKQKEIFRFSKTALNSTEQRWSEWHFPPTLKQQWKLLNLWYQAIQLWFALWLQSREDVVLCAKLWMIWDKWIYKTSWAHRPDTIIRMNFFSIFFNVLNFIFYLKIFYIFDARIFWSRNDCWIDRGPFKQKIHRGSSKIYFQSLNPISSEVVLRYYQ